MIVASARFVTSAVRASQYPPGDYPEIAFAGRSNVGKSSLINAILNRKKLVKTSSVPGKTQLLNFFLINEAFCFVDLPGYGYAKVPARIREQWRPMIETYLSGRSVLKGAVLIMDLRRTPGPDEMNLIRWLEARGLDAVLILTKADKLSKTKQAKHRAEAARALSVPEDRLILFSAKTRLGKDRVWAALSHLISG